MILAIIERYENIEEEKAFSKKLYLSNYFKEIFDKLNILLFPIITEKNLEKVSEICDGLIIPGSCIDINPEYYGEKIDSNIETNLQIDEYKLDAKAIKLFHEKNKSILGICGGMQSINVYFGGTLYQDIKNHNLESKEHKIKIEENSFLNKVYNTTELEVNSYHHQAVKTVAQNFNVTAMSADGIIEAIENDNIIGVQWHPEKINDVIFFKKFIQDFFS